LGCPKTKFDNVTITVIPPVTAFAGNDTAIVINQPLHFNATSNIAGSTFSWSPSTALSNSNIYNPYCTTKDYIEYILTVTTPGGCVGYDTIRVKVFPEPVLWVPSAFTPNGDGLNDIFRPITVGYSQIEYFRVYNRWGQLVYSTSQFYKGWDGTIKGTPQELGVYFWVLSARDFGGKNVQKQGDVTLIR
jgi:gliding motility-associated-like protein